MLLGNKVDLGNQRRVYMEQGIQVWSEFAHYYVSLLLTTFQFAQTQNMPFFETSCLTSVNVTEVSSC